jgi:nicotinate-nucleotide adenylyltransferase
MTLGVLGGTFDPIHNGHIAAAEAAQLSLNLARVLLVPSHIPPHRADPVGANSEQRFAMAQLAAGGRPGWSASRLEVDREGASYTYDTLVELRKDLSIRLQPDTTLQAESTQIFFILGADAFAEIATWSRYPAVLDLAHFVVVSRPGITLDSLRERVPSAFERAASADTRVILVEARTPDISSTDIRRRARNGESLRGLVPDAVAGYISAHRLYVGH